MRTRSCRIRPRACTTLLRGGSDPSRRNLLHDPAGPGAELAGSSGLPDRPAFRGADLDEPPASRGVGPPRPVARRWVISAVLRPKAGVSNQTDRSLRERLDLIAQSEPGLLIDGIPQRWLLRRTWRCGNQHVSTQLVAVRIRRRPRCVFCGRALFPTFPEDRNGPLPIRTAAEYRLIVDANMNRPARPNMHRRATRQSNGQAALRNVQVRREGGFSPGRAQHALAEARRAARQGNRPLPAAARDAIVRVASVLIPARVGPRDRP